MPKIALADLFADWDGLLRAAATIQGGEVAALN